MKNYKILIYTLFIFIHSVLMSQTGPGGIGTTDGTSNLRIWLDANDIDGDNDFRDNPVDGTAVSSWNDKSGSAVSYTQTGANRPTYNTGTFNAVNFDATLVTAQFMTGSAAGSYTDGSVFIVTNPVNNGTSNVFFDNSQHSLRVEQFSNTGFIGFTRYGVGDYTSTLPSVFAANSIYSFHKTGASSNLLAKVNGSSQSFAIGSNAYGIPYDALGKNGNGADEISGDFFEALIYNSRLNTAQIIIVENYLSAKYGGITIPNDIYAQDSPGNGNYDHDVAGIGRVDASNLHNDAQGTGIVQMLNPTGLGDNEFLIWGHDDGVKQAINTTDVPSPVQARFGRVWRASEVNVALAAVDVGSIDIRFDLTGLGAVTASDLRLLVDTDNDGVFNDETPISGATSLGSNVYQFAGVTAIANNVRFTIGTINAAATPLLPKPTGPGGVGATDGTSNLVLWLDANTVVGTNGSTITTWGDDSGNGHNFTVGNGAVFNDPSVNSYPAFNFNGSSHYFERAYTAKITPSNFTIFSATNVTSSGVHKAVISSRDDLGSNTQGFIFYSIPTSNNWEFWTGWGGAGWNVTTGGISTAGSWAGQVMEYQNTANGKVLYSNGSVSATNTHTMVSHTTRPCRIGAGRNESIPDYYFNGDIGEIIMFNTVINSAQRIIINNYLAAKYNYTLASGDLYDEDNAGSGNYDHDVAGIGRVDASNFHYDAQGRGIVRILNPTGLGNNEFLIWGHDNGILHATEKTDVPSPVQARFVRVWRASEVNASLAAVDVGSIDIRFDLTGIGAVTVSDLRLLVDTDNDGVFNDETPISGATSLGSNVYQFAGVTAIANNLRFTLGTINSIQTPLPIELLSFTAKTIDNKYVELKWQTASETNNNYFTIERSLDGFNWEIVTKVKGAGNSTTILSYSAVDMTPYFGVSYYRLKQTDFDDQFKYSKSVSVDFKKRSSNEVQIYPNPTNSQITIVGDKSELD